MTFPTLKLNVTAGKKKTHSHTHIEMSSVRTWSTKTSTLITFLSAVESFCQPYMYAYIEKCAPPTHSLSVSFSPLLFRYIAIQGHFANPSSVDFFLCHRRPYIQRPCLPGGPLKKREKRKKKYPKKADDQPTPWARSLVI